MVETALQWVAAAGSAFTAVATLGLVVVAWRTLGQASGQLLLLREQAERDSRPYVTLSVVPGLHGSSAWDLVVVNHGRSVARSVKIHIPNLAPRDQDDYITGPLETFASLARDLAPGERLRVMWRMARKDPKTDAGVAEAVTAQVSYGDDLGNRYEESHFLSTDAAAAMPAPTEGASVRGNGQEVRLKNIEHALRALNVHVGELRR